MKNKILFTLMIAALAMISCTKEAIEPQSQMVVIPQPPTSLYVEQMTSAYTSCHDTATQINSNVAGTVSVISTYTQYEFTATTDDGSRMRFKLKDKNGSTIVSGDTLKMTEVVYWTSCSSDSVVLRVNHNLPTYNVSMDDDGNSWVSLQYGDCVLPLNGLSGHISIVWRQ